MAIMLNAKPTIVIDGEVVIFEGFTETDPDVVEALSQSSDPDRTASDLLRFGVRAVRAVEADRHVQSAESRLDDLTKSWCHRRVLADHLENVAQWKVSELTE